MKKFHRMLLVALGCLLCIGGIAWAADAIGELSDAQLAQLDASAEFSPFANPQKPQSFVRKSTTQSATSVRRMAPRKAVTSVSDLTGTYVMTYEDYSENVGDGGGGVTITKGTGDTIVIDGFYSAGVKVKAAVDITNKTITIPNQVVATVSTYGNCDIAAATGEGKPDRTKSLTGTITDDGTITIDDAWGIFVMEGDYADYFFYVGCNTLFEVPNGNMNVTIADTTLTYDWPVVVVQTGKNLVTVKNFANHGLTVDIEIGTDSAATINSQMGWAYASYGNFYTYAANWTTTKLTDANITGSVTADAITWDNWTLYSTTSKVYVAKYATGTITGITFAIPTKTVMSLDGSGTESDPFRIRTLDDLVYLSDVVNNNSDLSYGTAKKPYGKMFEGQYFVVENDINMTGYRFTPIGKDFSHRFAGIIDGGNHTLTGLNVSTSTTGYAGLFGFADTTSVLKNFVLASPQVQSGGTGVGTLVGWSYGTISNCKVTDGDVNNTGSGTGGICGVGMSVSDCSFEGAVVGTGGTTGGIAGQTYGPLENCHAIATVKTGGSSEGATGGGIVGTMYGENTSCVNSYFYGVVDGSSAQNIYCGGIVGRDYRGLIDGCFAVARVSSYYVNGISAGICGFLIGDISNCYAVGYMSNILSPYVGGLVGKVSSTTSGGKTIQMTIKNSYFAGALLGTSTNYDVTTSTRGIVGQILTNAEPVFENCYYDMQLAEAYSTCGYGLLTAKMTTASGLDGFSSDKWTFTEGYYPRLKALADNDAAKVGASVLSLDATFPDNSTYTTKTAGIKTMGSTTVSLLTGKEYTTTSSYGTISSTSYEPTAAGTDYVVFHNSALLDDNYAYVIPLTVTPAAFDGSGTAEDPFQIKTKADVMLLGELTTTNKQNFVNVYFKQLNDIDMENDESFLGISSAYNLAHTVNFGGIYDGAGHTLKNLSVKAMAWDGDPTSDTWVGTLDSDKNKVGAGFVGILGTTGVVKNLTIDAGSKIDSYTYGGAFAGFNYGKIVNCRNYATVTAYGQIGGGIAGFCSNQSLVDSCLNAGPITGGYQTYGGIAGMTYGTIKNCMNVATVQAKVLSTENTTTSRLNAVGGIVGRALGGVFSNLANGGHISAEGGNVGGLFGYYKVSYQADDDHAGGNDTYTSVNFGTVFSAATATSGNIGGNGKPTYATIENVYYDMQITGIGAAANSGMGGATGKLTEDLVSGTALDGLDANVWSFAKGQYPVLKLFADDEYVQTAAKTVIYVQFEETVKTLTDDITLTSGGTWSLVDGTNFSISGTTVKVPEVDSELLSDTLLVTNGTFSTKYALTAVMEMPLAGEGTLEDPFQIVDVPTWKKFANYMAATQNNFSGQYVKIMNDINFTDSVFLPFGYDGTSFDGTLLGNNTTVSGITYTTTGTYQGAICLLGAGGTIQDLTLGGTITTAKSYTGGFVGKCGGTVKNCVNNIEIKATAATVGGFAGYGTGDAVFDHCVNNAAINTTKGNGAGFVGGGEAGITFLYCTNNGAVTNTGSVKNTAGFLANGYAATYMYCTNNGAITAQKAKDVSGFQAYAAGTGTMTFKSCVNTGALTCASEAAGMLASTPTTGTPVAIVADSCHNEADINCLVKGSYGAAGLFYRLTPSSKLSNCYNTGNITAAGSTYYCGGVWGSYVKATSEEQRSYVTNCYNTGNVTMVGSSAMGVGAVPAYSTISNCYNTGTITTDVCGSGIGHIMGVEAYIDNCWNGGDIVVTKNGAGGICGYGYYSAVITNCFNVGNITAASNAGGLGGQTLCKYVNCYNRGTVTADSNVGGLIGTVLSSTDKTQICGLYDCWNGGYISTTAETNVGNLIGNYDNWSADAGNKIENTYYVTDFNGSLASDAVGGTATTVKELAASTDLSGTWTYNDEYTYPIIPGFENNDAAKAFAVAVVLADGDTYADVKGQFTLGELDGVEWSTSSDNITTKPVALIGFPIDEMHSEVTLTATCGDFSAPWILYVNSTDVKETLSSANVLSQTYYNLSGVQVAEPQAGEIYIVVTTYNDGTRKATKILK